MDKKQTPHTPEKKEPTAKDAPLMHTFNEKSKTSSSPMKLIIVLIVVAFLGIGTGFGLSKVAKATGKQLLPVANLGQNQAVKGKVYGSNDIKTFKDTAEGTLQEGGINGEGQYHLVRPGGDSQNVYLTSSLIDLSPFIGQKMKVWGQTQAAQTAGWLMDVGRIQIE